MANKFAKCPSCGAISLDLNICDKCRKTISPAIDMNSADAKHLIQLNTASLSKRQFYGSKLKTRMMQSTPDGSALADKNFGENTPNRKVAAVKKGKGKRQEPGTSHFDFLRLTIIRFIFL